MPPADDYSDCISSCGPDTTSFLLLIMVIALFFCFIWYQTSSNSPKNK